MPNDDRGVDVGSANPPFLVAQIGDNSPESGSVSFAATRSGLSDNVLRDNFVLIDQNDGIPRRIVAGYTVVYPGCRTRGHEHSDREEVYYFLAGKGAMVIGDKTVNVTGGTAVYVAPGPFHTVHCDGPIPLTFLWVTSDIT